MGREVGVAPADGVGVGVDVGLPWGVPFGVPAGVSVGLVLRVAVLVGVLVCVAVLLGDGKIGGVGVSSTPARAAATVVSSTCGMGVDAVLSLPVLPLAISAAPTNPAATASTNRIPSTQPQAGVRLRRSGRIG